MNNIEYRDLYLEELTNKFTKNAHKTALNIFLGIEEDNNNNTKQTKILKNFTDKTVLEFNKKDIKDFFNLLNKDVDHWSLSTKKVIFPKIKKFLIWIIDYYLDDPNDTVAKQLYYMKLINFLNNSTKFKFEKNGHKASSSNKEVILTIEELENLFKAIMDYPNGFEKAKPVYSIMYRILTETGCRITEFCSIVLDAKVNSHSVPIEEDLKERKLRVKWIKTEDKDQKLFKFYPISEEFKTILLSYVSGRRSENERDQKLPNFLFVTKRKSKMTPQNMYYNIKQYCKKAGINKSVSAHVFRHTLNNHRANNKCPIDIRASLLNHGTGNVNDEYTHMSWDKKLEAFDLYQPYKKLFNIK